MYPIVARALGLAAAFRPSARASKGILHTNIEYDPGLYFSYFPGLPVYYFTLKWRKPLVDY